MHTFTSPSSRALFVPPPGSWFPSGATGAAACTSIRNLSSKQHGNNIYEGSTAEQSRTAWSAFPHLGGRFLSLAQLSAMQCCSQYRAWHPTLGQNSTKSMQTMDINTPGVQVQPPWRGSRPVCAAPSR